MDRKENQDKRIMRTIKNVLRQLNSSITHMYLAAFYSIKLNIVHFSRTRTKD